MGLEISYCRQRQARVADRLRDRGLDRAVLLRSEHVQYLTGFRPHRLLAAAACLDADGWCLLVAPNQAPRNHAADDVVTFEAQWHATLRQDQPHAAALALQTALADRPKTRKVGVEGSIAGLSLRAALGDDLVDIEPDLWVLRRCKDPDELALIRRAVACTHAMYERARAILAPGITELEVYSQLHAAAVEAAGEPLSDLGNDFQCGSPGGPPRPRQAQAGELYILDLGPAYRGYYADNCRTFALSQPTDEQRGAWQRCVEVLSLVEDTVRPGVSCRHLFHTARDFLDAYRPGGFSHHLGHGIGLFPHETPHLNPHWEDTFAEGDVFTVEPGLYGADLRGGVRLEQDYLVTATGIERLTSFPLDL